MHKIPLYVVRVYNEYNNDWNWVIVFERKCKNSALLENRANFIETQEGGVVYVLLPVQYLVRIVHC